MDRLEKRITIEVVSFLDEIEDLITEVTRLILKAIDV